MNTNLQLSDLDLDLIRGGGESALGGTLDLDGNGTIRSDDGKSVTFVSSGVKVYLSPNGGSNAGSSGAAVITATKPK